MRRESEREPGGEQATSQNEARLPKTLATGSFTNVLKRCGHLSDWAKWVVIDQSVSAKSTREFLDYAFSCLPKDKQNLLAKLISGFSDPRQIDDRVYELVAHQILWQRDLSPEYDPNEGGKSPDLLISVNKQEFIVDVFVTNSPSKTIEGPFSKDTDVPGENRGQKIADRVRSKVGKYSSLGKPIILFVFLGDHRILDARSAEQALYGVKISEFSEGDVYPQSFLFERRLGRCLLSPDMQPDYQSLSALIVCDWFDTLNRREPGKRLNCIILHHFAAKKPLPPNTFSPFQEIGWVRVGENAWKPVIHGTKNIVARFGRNREFEYHEYSPDTPW